MLQGKNLAGIFLAQMHQFLFAFLCYLDKCGYVHDNFIQVILKIRALHMNVCLLCLSVSSVLYSQQNKL